jgi:hypothetical protein
MKEKEYKVFQRMWNLNIILLFLIFLFVGFVIKNLVVAMVLGTFVLMYYIIKELDRIEYKLDGLIK